MKFRVTYHSVRHVEVVEVFNDSGAFIATIVPGDHDAELRVVSKHLPNAEGMMPGVTIIKLKESAK